MYLYYWYFISSWNQVGVQLCRWIPVFMTGSYLPVNLEHQKSTVFCFLDLLQSGQEAQGRWWCRRMCRWSSSKQNTLTTDRAWGKHACASEWTHLNSGDSENSSGWQSDSSNCASDWFHAVFRHLDTACCFIKPSDGKSSEIWKSRSWMEHVNVQFMLMMLMYLWIALVSFRKTQILYQLLVGRLVYK